MKTIETILTLIGAFYVIASTLAGVLPAGTPAQKFFARVALALKGAQKPPGVDPKIVALAFAIATTAACSGCASPRHAIRGGVLTMAHASKSLDKACAKTASARRDATLAESCARGYDAARDALLSAESALDAWGDADQSRALCAASKGARALAQSVEAASKAGTRLAPIVIDGLKVAEIFARETCAQ